MLSYLQRTGHALKQISGGKEYTTHCPACGDGGKGAASDRFHVWPDAVNNGLCMGRYWCRMCGVSGDSIKFYQEFASMSFVEACAELGINLETGKQQRRQHAPMAMVKSPGEPWTPREYQTPPARWQEKAANLLADCKQRLANEPEAIAWLEARGISRAMIDAYELGYNQSTKNGDRYRPRSLWGLENKVNTRGKETKKLWIPRGWVIPNIRGGEVVQLRIRRRPEDIARFADNIKYLPIDGSSPAPLILNPGADVFVTTESGFDAILIAGSMHGKVGAVCTWSDGSRPDVVAHGILKRSALILGGLDFDSAGDAQTDWWDTQYRQHRRMESPGAKDPGEAYAAGVNIREWVVDNLPRGLRISLGFASGFGKHARPAKAQEQEKTTAQEEKTDAPRVVDVTLKDGTVISMTNDEGSWQAITSDGRPVYTSMEMEHLKRATASTDGEKRTREAVVASEVKAFFGGKITASRAAQDDSSEHLLRNSEH